MTETSVAQQLSQPGGLPPYPIWDLQKPLPRSSSSLTVPFRAKGLDVGLRTAGALAPDLPEGSTNNLIPMTDRQTQAGHPPWQQENPPGVEDREREAEPTNSSWPRCTSEIKRGPGFPSPQQGPAITQPAKQSRQ